MTTCTTTSSRASARRHPARYMLYPLRPFARFVIRRRVKVRVLNGEKLPRKGPVILASNHVGIADGPLLAIFAPRPVHALTKQEMFKGFMSGFLLGAGQIPLDRFNPDPARGQAMPAGAAQRAESSASSPRARAARGSSTGSTPVRRTSRWSPGAPIVPVVQFGTREPGAGSHSLPAKGVVVDMVFGDPITHPHDAVAAAQAGRREGVPRAPRAPDRAPRRTPRRSPAGPCPDRCRLGLRDDPDPATGVTDQEAM